MTAPTAPDPTRFGPGWLRFGDAAAVEASCSVNSATIEPAVDVGEETFKLCGSSVPGAITGSGTLSANIDIDTAEDGLFEYLTVNAGKPVPFTFLPHGTRDPATGVVTAEATDLEARGQVIAVPPPFGGDTPGDVMTGDLSMNLTGTSVDYYRDGSLAFSFPLGPIT